ncbi:MAG: HEPN domain-containing protein [Candidatus Aenigmarchaeota archaeon]|nr:HEPN domain-containing protein [Candidatus Aenigmarchaeota archaeon]
MDSMVEIFLERANNEIFAAESLKRLSEEAKSKEEFRLPGKITFYSSVISHSYYAIFYSAKAILLAKNIRTFAPEIHKKTFDRFKENLVDTGILDAKLLEIYRTIIIRADEMLEIFKDEKWKRGNFTYNTIPQANKEPAEDSLRNAKLFVSNIMKVTERM